MIDGDEFAFGGGFTDLHTRSYDDILQGVGFGFDETRKAIELMGKLC